MDYEIVSLEEKTVVGITARTSNGDESMGMVIGGLWQSFFADGVYAGIQGKVSQKPIGLYSDYAGDEKGEYSITVCCEVQSGEDIPAGAVKKTIPSGSYAKFIVRGGVQKDVAEFWGRLWNMPLNRRFSADFEEYQNDSQDNAEIHMYIALAD